MFKLIIALFVAAALGASGAGTSHAASTPMSKDDYTMAMKNADAQLKTDREACMSLSGNAKDICIAEAKGRNNVAKSEAEAAFENTPKARERARIARAQASYDVAAEKCDDLAGNRKDVCMKEAKAALVRGKADAKVDRVVADTSQESATKQAEARSEANADKLDADYKVAIEKCDMLAGVAKVSCVSNAKLRYGKS